MDIKRNPEIQLALKIAIKNLLTTIKKNGQLQEHHRRVSEAKIYDRLQKKYIQRQMLKKELGDAYESSGSDSQQQKQYKGLKFNQVRYLIRKKLIKKKFSQKYLQQIILCAPPSDKPNEEAPDSNLDVNQREEYSPYEEYEEGLKIINEANEIFTEDLKQDKNLFALKFIIDQLQAYAKQNRKQSSNI